MPNMQPLIAKWAEPNEPALAHPPDFGGTDVVFARPVSLFSKAKETTVKRDTTTEEGGLHRTIPLAARYYEARQLPSLEPGTEMGERTTHYPESEGGQFGTYADSESD